MKVMTILGTRPEIIRLSLIIKKLDQLSDEHVVVHTGQNYDRSLSDVFFDEMNIRGPDIHIHLGAESFGKQISAMFAQLEEVILKVAPDRILVLGDTNSALCAVLAARMGIPVYHMEAGNRCYDDRVPEEVNRKIIDAVATYNLPYTPRSRENLLREGMAPSRIWQTGNPINEVLRHYQARIANSQIMSKLGLTDGAYFLVTAHRAENVDDPLRLFNIITALQGIAQAWDIPVIYSVHPRTRSRLAHQQIVVTDNRVRLMEPFGFFDFAQLQQHALCVLTDSGTVQEESCLYRVPTVTIRASTERPETVACGSNTVAGLLPEDIVRSVRVMLARRRDWEIPEGYEDGDVSAKVVTFVLGGLTHV